MEKGEHIVILLCPSEAKIVNDKYSYYDLEKDKKEPEKTIYIGGAVRMQAAVDYAKTGYVESFIVVGGSKPKVDGMKNYLEQEFKSQKVKNWKLIKLVRFISEADTLGNLRAIKKELKNLEGKKLCIMTNFYHLPRALVFAQNVFPNITFEPLAAEALITKGLTTDTLFSNELILRLFREKEGLKDWENGTYKNQEKKDESKWESDCLDEDLLKKLNLI